MTASEQQYMAVALEAARTALAEGNAPYGAVVVRGGQSIVGRNLTITSSDPTAHAESVAIREAAGVWQTCDLSGAILYATYEPCPMCCGAMLASGIQEVVISVRRLIGEPPLGDYTVERLLEMTGQRAAVTVRSDVLAEACSEFYASVAG
jgi:tRNA(adenine34) deaminase